MDEGRWEPRASIRGFYSLTWRDTDGNTHSTEASGLDISGSGIGLECFSELAAGSIVFVEARDGSLEGDCEVVHCTRRGQKYHIGFEFREDIAQQRDVPIEAAPRDSELDYYETLQISRKADIETIHRVFRIMAVRFHPDNPETGDVETFLRMKRAYAVLSDPERRAEYNATLDKTREEGPRPIFARKDFVTGTDAESNRRLGVLSILYNQRQTDPEHPAVTLLDLERDMGFPREYLSFTMWYLRAKEFVTAADNSDYAITASGADFVEKKAARNEIMVNLLNMAAPRAPSSGKRANGRKGSAAHQPRRLLV
jgi:curved DNA-binding protein CbpA